MAPTAGARRVENGDKHQRPAGRCARITNFRHGKKPDNDVRQAGRTDHQRHCVHKHIDVAELRRRRVFGKAKIVDDLIQPIEQIRVRPGHGSAKAELRNRIAGQFSEMNTAGIVYARISTQYCAICVYVMPFMPPSTA